MPEALPPADILRNQLEDLAAEWLAPPVERFARRLAAPRPTIINDPLWGSIRLYSWEVALLDTELAQRLRFLRQLGVVHWVYPAAGHSRLEHSLGVLRQMQELLDGLERNSGVAGERLVDDVTVKLLRIAALLHDCGHVVMSHVPEPLVKMLPGVRELVANVLTLYHARKEPSPSEAFAAVFVTSPAFIRFLRSRYVGADFITDAEEAARKIASFIVAGAGEPGKGFLSLLINGAYDADKLDYMPRDCLMAGVPCGVDVERVIEKVQCLSVPAEKVKREYVEWSPPDSEGNVRVLALSKSGGKRILHELATTRTILYDKVYYHHKVRALEVMVRRLLTKYHEAKRPTVADWLKLTDEELLLMPYPEARALRERRLLKRAFFVVPPAKEIATAEAGDATAVPQNADTKAAARGWRRLRDDIADGNRALADAIWTETKRAAAILRLPDPPEELAVAVDFPSQAKLGLDQYAFVGDGLGDFNQADIETAGERPETSKRLATSGGYVFVADEYILPTFLAARLVLQRDYAQTYDERCYATTKLDADEIRKAEEALRHEKYFAGAPNMAPVPNARIITHREVALETFLKVAWPRIQALGVKFGRYQSQVSTPVSPTSIAAYLRQFETEDLARAGLRLLEHIDFKDRTFFRRSVESLLRQAVESGSVACVCPFGATGDSSALLAYLMSDMPEPLMKPVRPLELALDDEGNDGAIVLWDDFCGRGGHSLTALSQWLGEPLPEFGLHEDLVDKLSAARAARMRAVQLRFAFSIGTDLGISRLRGYADSLGLHSSALTPEEILPPVDDVFTSSVVFSDKDEREGLRDFLHRIGRRLLEGNVIRRIRPWSESDLQDRLLGYGNGCHRLVFHYNVPSVTLTALWETGEKWTPLFPRRRKPPSST